MKIAIPQIAPNNVGCIILGLNLDLLEARLRPSEKIFHSIESRLQIPLFHIDHQALVKAEFSELLESISDHAQKSGRRNLLIAGAFLDEHVSTATLAALVKGLNAYLLCDVIGCKDPKFENVFIQRLMQSGAVPTTLGQCLFHWSLLPENELNREALAELSHDLNEIMGDEQGAPRFARPGHRAPSPRYGSLNS